MSHPAELSAYLATLPFLGRTTLSRTEVVAETATPRQPRVVFDAFERSPEVGLGMGGGMAGVSVHPCLLDVFVRGAQCRQQGS